MNAITAALVAAAIQAVAQIVEQLAQGKISDEQAQAYLTAAKQHYDASIAAWNAAPEPGEG